VLLYYSEFLHLIQPFSLTFVPLPENHPGIVQSAMSLYEKHPTLIKTLGLFAAAAISKHASEKK